MTATPGNIEDTNVSTVQAITSASARTYTFAGHDVQTGHLDVSKGAPCSGSFVQIKDLHRVEYVFDSDVHFPTARALPAAATGRGLDAWALVPLNKLGEAQSAFGAAASHVQGWWETDEVIKFSDPVLA